MSGMDKEICDDLNISKNSIKKSSLRLSKSLNIYTPKLSEEIKELSKSTLVSSIELFNTDICKNQFNISQTINRGDSSIDKENNFLISKSQISLEIGDTRKFTEFVSQNVFTYNQLKTPNLFFVNDYKSDEEIEEEIEETNIEMNQSEKKKQKRFALSWVGKSVGKIGKRNQTYHVHNSNSKILSSKKNISSSDQNNTTDSVASMLRHQSSNSSLKKLIRTDWSENAKQGIHIWSDFSSQTNEPCYLSEQDAIEFHNLNKNLLCYPQSKILNKKKCLICKIVVHEACIESVQKNIKCKTTFREASIKKKSFKEKNDLNLLRSNVNLHHWLCHRYDETIFDNRCQQCLKNYTNKFGIQTSRNIIFCSWCKISYHFRCFPKNLLQKECSFGEFKNMIIPPNWIIKSSNKNHFRSNSKRTNFGPTKCHHEQQIFESADEKSLLVSPCTSSQNSHRNVENSFFIRPNPSICGKNLITKPILILINPKSGGKLGPKLLTKFTWFLNPRQVFDLTLPGCPKLPLYLYRNVPNLRILVGGGDGTVGWILSEIDQIKFLISPPSVAVLPLGTGNDLARSLNWGSGYSDEPLNKILDRVLESRATKLDRWKISIKPNSNFILKDLEKEDDNILKNDIMNNYFSLGADAHVCLEFHEKREANPNRFSSRWFNLLQYFEAGSKDMIKKTWRDLKNYITLECDGKNYTDIIKSRGYHCLIFLNIQKYSSGTNPWGNFENENYQPQAMNDGRLEVIGCFTSTLAKLQIGGYGERLCQANRIKLITTSCIPIQIDGEPTKLGPSIIEIFHKNQATMLENKKKHTDSPILNCHETIQNSFEVKCLLKTDYDLFRNDYDMLRKKSFNVGTICTFNLTDSLAKVRKIIELLLKNCNKVVNSFKWTFLNGDEFFGISEDSDECLIDILTSDWIIYILDETNRDIDPNLYSDKVINIKNKECKNYTESSVKICDIQKFQLNSIVPIIKPTEDNKD